MKKSTTLYNEFQQPSEEVLSALELCLVLSATCTKNEMNVSELDFHDFPPFGHPYFQSCQPCWEHDFGDKSSSNNKKSEVKWQHPSFEPQWCKPSSTITYVSSIPSLLPLQGVCFIQIALPRRRRGRRGRSAQVHAPQRKVFITIPGCPQSDSRARMRNRIKWSKQIQTGGEFNPILVFTWCLLTSFPGQCAPRISSVFSRRSETHDLSLILIKQGASCVTLPSDLCVPHTIQLLTILASRGESHHAPLDSYANNNCSFHPPSHQGLLPIVTFHLSFAGLFLCFHCSILLSDSLHLLCFHLQLG